MKTIFQSCLLLALYAAELYADDIGDLSKQIENSHRLSAAGHSAEAEAQLRATIRGAEQRGDTARAAFALNALALLYEKRGRYLDAEKMMHRAVRTLEGLEGADSSAAAVVGKDLASLYLITGRFSKAQSLLQRIIRILEDTPMAEPVLVDALTDLGCLYAWTKRVAQAEPLFRRALDIAMRDAARNDVQMANCLNYLAFTALLGKRYPEAIILNDQSMQILDQVENPPPQSRILAIRIRVAAEFKNEEFSEAERWLQQALALAEGAYGHDHPAVGNILLEYSTLLHRLHRNGEAKRMKQRADAISAANLRTNGGVYVVDLSELLRP